MASNWKRTFCLAMLLVGMSGCIPLKQYRTNASPPPTPSDAPLTTFVEYDEFGHAFDPHEMSNAVAQATATAAANGLVIVYVHGWHHNASKSDGNVDSFQKVLERAAEIDASYGVPPRPILGVYVGWRGESVNSHHWYSKLFSELTFWDRKNTAHAVGNGEVLELLQRLSSIRQAHQDSRLVVIGHSFGGAVVYSTLAHKLIEQILADEDPAVNQEQLLPPVSPWDLAIVVNPAFEAMRLRPQFELASSREYGPEQGPHLVLITSTADSATGIFFPIGRKLSTMFDTYADGDPTGRDLNTTAVGHYLPYVTHQLAPSPVCQRGPPSLVAPTTTTAALLATTNTYCFNDGRALQEGATPLLLTRCDADADCGAVAPHHHIARGKASDGLMPYRLPIMNIRTTEAVMADHNDIWNPSMQGLLTQLVILGIHRPDLIPMAPRLQAKPDLK